MFGVVGHLITKPINKHISVDLVDPERFLVLEFIFELTK